MLSRWTRCSRLGRMASAASAASAAELQLWRRGLLSYDEGGWIQLNAAGASPTSQEVHDAVIRHMQLEREVGGYEAEARFRRGRDPRAAAAELLNCEASEVAVTQSAQSAFTAAFASLKFERKEKEKKLKDREEEEELKEEEEELKEEEEGKEKKERYEKKEIDESHESDEKALDHIFCWESEYAGNAVTFLQAEKKGIKLQVLPMQGNGMVDVLALEEALKAMPASSCALICLTHIQTNSSIIQPAATVGAIAKKYHAIFLLDACQSIGQLPVDVRSLGCDFACATGRKWLRGPRGTGLLYARQTLFDEEEMNLQNLNLQNVKRRCLGEPAMIDHVSASWTSSRSYVLHPSARRFEMWEYSPGLHAGLAKALDACKAIGPQRIFQRARFLADLLRQSLRDIPGLRLADGSLDSVDSRCAIVTFEAEKSAELIKDALTQRRITSSVAPAFHTFNDKAWKKPSTLRLSPSYYNTEEEIQIVAQAVREILK